MSIRVSNFFNGCDVITDLLSRIFRSNRLRIQKYEINFDDLSDRPGKEEAILTIKVWNKKGSEASVIEHWYLVEGAWEKR